MSTSKLKADSHANFHAAPRWLHDRLLPSIRHEVDDYDTLPKSEQERLMGFGILDAKRIFQFTQLFHEHGYNMFYLMQQKDEDQKVTRMLTVRGTIMVFNDMLFYDSGMKLPLELEEIQRTLADTVLSTKESWEDTVALDRGLCVAMDAYLDSSGYAGQKALYAELGEKHPWERWGFEERKMDQDKAWLTFMLNVTDVLSPEMREEVAALRAKYVTEDPKSLKRCA